jgi:peroxiredoxin
MFHVLAWQEVASLIGFAALAVIVLIVGFLLLGALRVVGRLSWRLDQLEATQATRAGRGGLRPGKRAPDFTLVGTRGGDVSLHDFVGRKVLLVFTQTGCGPCEEIAPELKRLVNDNIQVLVVNKGVVSETRQWAARLDLPFPVLIQDDLTISRKYEVFATPFAFLIDARGVVIASGIILTKQHLGYILADGDRRSAPHTSDNLLVGAHLASQP